LRASAHASSGDLPEPCVRSVDEFYRIITYDVGFFLTEIRQPYFRV